jgi:hypothetical protein
MSRKVLKRIESAAMMMPRPTRNTSHATTEHAVRYLAIDLGAESGRVVVGDFDRRRLALGEVDRSPNVPVTAIGELAVQAIAAGELASVAEARELTAHSFPLTTYGPAGDWSEARARFAGVCARAAR